MGKRGPKRTETAVLKLRGSWLAAKRADAKAALTPSKRVRCPQWLSPDAKAIWRALSPELYKLGLLDGLSKYPFTVFCQTFAAYRKSVMQLQKTGMVYRTSKGEILQNPLVRAVNQFADQCLTIAKEFGLTPSSRLRIDLPTPKAEPEIRKDRFFKPTS